MPVFKINLMWKMIPVPYPATIICIKAPTKKLTPNVLDNAGNTENPFFKSFSIELAKSSFDFLVLLEESLLSLLDLAFSINGLRASSNLGTSSFEVKFESRSQRSDNDSGFLYPCHTNGSAQKYNNWDK